jgi:hypothetical protein
MLKGDVGIVLSISHRSADVVKILTSIPFLFFLGRRLIISSLTSRCTRIDSLDASRFQLSLLLQES